MPEQKWFRTTSGKQGITGKILGRKAGFDPGASVDLFLATNTPVEHDIVRGPPCDHDQLTITWIVLQDVAGP